MYADRITDSMKHAIGETERRRKLQAAYNKRHGITPKTVRRELRDALSALFDKDEKEAEANKAAARRKIRPEDIPRRIAERRAEMLDAARRLEYERAAELRDEILALEDLALEVV